MVSISAEARIEAPAEKVWARLTDWPTYAEWNSTHTRFPQGGPASLEVGASFREDVSLMGMPGSVDWQVAEVEPLRVLVIRGKGPAGISILSRYTLTPDGSATTVQIHNEYSGGPVAIMGGKLKEALPPTLNESLSKLSALLKS